MRSRTGARHAALVLMGTAALTLAACTGGATPQTSGEAVTVTSTAPTAPAAAEEVGRGEGAGGERPADSGQPDTPAGQDGGRDRGQAQQPQGAAPAPQPGPRPADGPPCEATSYTVEAQHEMRDENVTPEEVADVLARACAGGGEVEWEDDGYWEIEVGEIDVDVYPNGVVHDVDR